MRLKARLTSESIKQMVADLQGFEDGLRNNLRDFRNRLADKGIHVAMSNVNQVFGQYIAFLKEESDESVTIVARETQQIMSEWLHYGMRVWAYISPLLMSEFGSGSHAVLWEDSKGNQTGTLSDGTKVGRGTFPEQIHAFQNSWAYMDLNWNWHHTSGITPTRPMHNAVLEIITQVEQTAREVFGNG